MNDLVDQLTSDLKPVTPLKALWLWAVAAVGLAAAATFVVMVLGMRVEMGMLVYGHRLPANPVVLMKPALFLVSGLSAIWAVSGLVRPEGRLKLRYLLPVLAVMGIIVGNLMSELVRSGTADIAEKLNGGVSTCFMTILTGGLIGLAALWWLWLRKAATSYPVSLGAMSGLATASLMAAAYALHCNMDAPVYIFAVYGLAVAAFTGFAALLGGRMLRW
ncbi:MAG: NrsF family protein [Asticcacaulis sp.]